VTPSEAAMNHLASMGIAEPDLVVGKVQEFEWGWTVHVNTAEFWESHDPMKMLVGLSPVFVSRQLRCQLFATGLSFERMCEQFAAECGVAK
jgi:hypothetical protein